MDQKSTLSASQLPDSLWQYIASFLPLSAIQSTQLYSINRAFLEYYLENKYQTSFLDLDDRLGLFVSRDGRVFSIPLIAGAVKTLRLKLTEKLTMTSIFTDFSRLICACSLSSSKRHPSAIFEGLPERLGLMKNLKAIEYTITSRNFVPILDFNKLFPAGLASAWKASRTSLTCLSLVFNMAFIPKLDLAEITFPNLREIAFMFDSRGCIGKPRCKKLRKSTHADLIPFINHHRETVSTLSLFFREGSYDLGHYILSNLRTLPALRDLTICMNFPRKLSSSGLGTILQEHAKQIERLDLQLEVDTHTNGRCMARGCAYPCSELWWKSQLFMQIIYPRLTHLKCRFGQNDHCALLLWYLKHVASKVKMLDLRRGRGYASHSFRLEELEALTHIFYKAESTNSLEILKIDCTDFTPQILLILAKTLPKLKTLHMSFSGVALDEPEPPVLGTLYRDPILRAYRVIASGPFLDWGLEALVLDDWVASSSRSQSSHKPTLFKTALSMALPNLKSFKYLRRGVPLPN